MIKACCPPGAHLKNIDLFLNGHIQSLVAVPDLNGSVYSAFYRCKGGADQGCRHLGATLFELDDFLSNQRKSLTSVFAYWNPKPMPTHKPVPISEMKISYSCVREKKRKFTTCDDFWIDSFDPRNLE